MNSTSKQEYRSKLAVKKKPELLQKKKEFRFLREKPRWVF
jgi:hypothetical protein